MLTVVNWQREFCLKVTVKWIFYSYGASCRNYSMLKVQHSCLWSQRYRMGRPVNTTPRSWTPVATEANWAREPKISTLISQSKSSTGSDCLKWATGTKSRTFSCLDWKLKRRKSRRKSRKDRLKRRLRLWLAAKIASHSLKHAVSSLCPLKELKGDDGVQNISFI